MTDIIERLTNWFDLDGREQCLLAEEAAKEIERLREIEWMYNDLCK